MHHWEARRIVRGYRKRNILQYQLQRIQAWAAMFCMGNPHHTQPDDILHLYFDDEDQKSAPQISQEEVEELQKEIAAINSNLRSSEE